VRVSMSISATALPSVRMGICRRYAPMRPLALTRSAASLVAYAGRV
jgi:hypothetical protein